MLRYNTLLVLSPGVKLVPINYFAQSLPCLAYLRTQRVIGWQISHWRNSHYFPWLGDEQVNGKMGLKTLFWTSPASWCSGYSICKSTTWTWGLLIYCLPHHLKSRFILFGTRFIYLLSAFLFKGALIIHLWVIENWQWHIVSYYCEISIGQPKWPVF